MRALFSVLALAAVLLFTGFVPATQYGIGSEVSDFSLKNVDGRMVSLATYPEAKGFMIVFTCNHCPYAKKYQQRLNVISKKYAPQGVQLIAISSTDPKSVPEDSYEEMVAISQQEHYSYPYLMDSTQSVAKAFKAVKTPHAFVVFKEHGKWIVKYSGAIDDNGADEQKVTHHYVTDAVDALLSGKVVAIAETKSVGCAIKFGK